MAGVGAQACTFQLSSKAAEKTGGNVEQYRLQLGIREFTPNPFVAVSALTSGYSVGLLMEGAPHDMPRLPRPGATPSRLGATGGQLGAVCGGFR